MSDFERELSDLLNRHSVDNETNTPDFILADYLNMAIEQLVHFNKKRDAHSGDLQKAKIEVLDEFLALWKQDGAVVEDVIKKIKATIEETK